MALERQASPEQLDTLLHLTSPKAWLALIALGLVLLAVLAWGLFGSVPVEASGQGFLQRGDEGLRARLFFPAGSAGRIAEGMEAAVSLRGVEPAEYGYLRGRVASISDKPVTRQELGLLLGDDDVARALSSAGPCVEVMIALIPDSLAPTGYRWSSSEGPDMRLLSGASVAARVLIAERRPISLLLPLAKKSLMGDR